MVSDFRLCWLDTFDNNSCTMGVNCHKYHVPHGPYESPCFLILLVISHTFSPFFTLIASILNTENQKPTLQGYETCTTHPSMIEKHAKFTTMIDLPLFNNAGVKTILMDVRRDITQVSYYACSAEYQNLGCSKCVLNAQKYLSMWRSNLWLKELSALNTLVDSSFELIILAPRPIKVLAVY